MCYQMTPNDSHNHERGTGEGSTTVPDTALSLNALLDVLTHHHRRETLRLLIDDSDHTIMFDELTTHLMERETNWTGKHLGRDHIETQLHHIHLPKLTSVGLVEYDARSQELRYWQHERLEALLEDLQSYTVG